MSLRPRADLSQMRFMELILFHVRPGKQEQWSEVVKMAKTGYEKGIPDSHWECSSKCTGPTAAPICS